MSTDTKAEQEPACSGGEEDWRLPGLELQHDIQIALKDWASLAPITEGLAAFGADVRSLSLNRRADAFVLRCRVTSISAARAREFVNGLADVADGAASVEHLMLARAADHAGA